jgi:hypothetical protein
MTMIGIGPFENDLAEAFAAIEAHDLKPNRICFSCGDCGQVWISGNLFPCDHIKEFFEEFTKDMGA